MFSFAQIALAIGVLTSGVRVHRFCGFVLGGCRAGCRLSCSFDVCLGEGSQIQGRALICVWVRAHIFFGFVSGKGGKSMISFHGIWGLRWYFSLSLSCINCFEVNFTKDDE